MFERVAWPDGFVAYRSSLLAGTGARHLFSTRHGPGTDPFDLTGLPPARVDRVTAALECDGRVAAAWQVHGTDVVNVERAGLGPRPDNREAWPKADGLMTDEADVVVNVRTADCVPILLASSDGRRVAAVHAGWRGLVAGVVEAGLNAFEPGEDMVAAIGPCLCAERFEVGPEVARAFVDAGLSHAVRPDLEHPHVDMRLAVRTQLERAGVTRVDVSHLCTWNTPDFFSYRRDVTHGDAARTAHVAAFVAPRP